MKKIEIIEKLLDFIKNILRDILRFFYQLFLILIAELQNHVSLSVFHTFRAFKNGFYTFNYRLYGLETYGDPKDFISDYIQVVRMPTINGEYEKVINNKLLFPDIMEKYDMPCPKIHAIIRKGILYRTNTGERQSLKDFAKSMIQDQKLVLKPIKGFHGNGIIIIQKNGTHFNVNRENLEFLSFSELISSLDNYLISAYIIQCETSASFFPDTVNTVRLVTCLDGEHGKSFIAQAVHRIGTSRSYPVDNFKAGLGGLSAPVNLKTGRLGQAASVSEKAEVTWHSHHPETGNQIKGTTVHNWNEIKYGILSFAEKLIFTPYIAWDVVPIENGYSVIEANAMPGTPVMQVHGPLLTSEKIRQFFKHHHIIR